VILVRTGRELDHALAASRDAGSSIGLVPTMGAFHAGHLGLVSATRERDELVVVSLFVNPTQFGPSEDLARYPRDEARDVATAEAAGVDVLFVPSESEIYPPGFDSWIDPGRLGTVLEGAVRPGHFRGVATVCARLFGLVRPARAYFGRKDAQQVAVVKQVVRDLALPLEIVPCPTVRDPDGLALSSRNVYLSASERRHALALPRALQAGLEAHRAGNEAVDAARAVLDATPEFAVDYVAVADLDGPTLAAAGLVGTTRLIDNVRLDEQPQGA
jgi:pantoate--beta-alanine ligase